MEKDVSLTIRLNPDLRDRFIEAAALEHRPTGHVLRDLMRDYVQRSGLKSVLPPSPISEQEQQRRREAVEFGWASVELEGFTVPDAEKIHAQRFIDGEIDKDEYVKGAVHGGG